MADERARKPRRALFIENFVEQQSDPKYLENIAQQKLQTTARHLLFKYGVY